jgi:hypothetical protein
LEELIRNKIVEINNKISEFDNSVRNYLQERFLNDIQDHDIRAQLIERFRQENYVKARIKDIANELYYYHGDLKKFYDAFLYTEFLSSIQTEDLVSALENTLSEHIESQEAFRYIKNDFKKISEKFMILVKGGGFQSNLMNLNEGVMVANSGDSAQFMFISRAILVGFNSSNVDVRSSRYDAIIDYEGTLLKVQVKGVSGNVISFKDRDRGGQGIDHTHERNIGQIITSGDCDIYVAVDKQCGICYIIPMYEIDQLPDEDKVRVRVSDLSQYLENWDIIKEVANRKNTNE